MAIRSSSRVPQTRRLSTFFCSRLKKLSIAALRAIQKFITGLYVQSSGLNTNLYKSAFTNQIITANGASINNPPLTIQGLQDAFKVLARMLDADGQPIVLSGSLYLWYGPALIAAGAIVGLRVTASMLASAIALVIFVGPAAMDATWTNPAGQVVAAVTGPGRPST